MNFTLKALTAAVVLSGAMANSFAASVDNLPTNGGGTGAGDLVFAYEASTASGLVSILWDLSNGATDLNVNDMLTSAAFSIANTNVTSFVAANPGGRWNIFGLTNLLKSGTPGTSTLVYDRAGVALTIDGAPVTGTSATTGSTIEARADSLAAWTSNANINSTPFPDNGTLVAGENDLFAFTATGHGDVLVGQDATAGLNSTMGFWTILIDSTVARGSFANSGNALGKQGTFTQLGTFGFNGTNLVYNPTAVPLPPAVWLLGSALAGVAGLRRRSV